MKLIKTIGGNYINIQYIKYIYILPSNLKYYVNISEDSNKDIEISKETYDYLINNYYEQKII